MQSTVQTSPRPPAKIRRSPLDFVAIFAGLLVVTLLATTLAWQFWHNGRIYAGVEVAGVPVGGLTRSEAIAKLERTAPTVAPPPVVLTVGAERIPLADDTLSPQWNKADAVNQAYLLGRQGNFSKRLAHQLGLALGGYDLRPQASYEVAELRQTLSEVANQVLRPAEAGFSLEGSQTGGQPGLAMDVESTLSLLAASLDTQRSHDLLEVPVTTVDLAPPVAVSLPEAVSSAEAPMPLLLSDSRFGLEAALDPGQLDEIIFSSQPLRVDQDALHRHLQTLADQFEIVPRDARLRFNPATGGIIVLRSSQSGRSLDIEATTASVEAALADGEERAQLVMTEVAPTVDMNRIAEMGIRELVASGTTYFGGSSAARVRNIEVAAEKFDGVVIPPGDSFSFNRFVEDVSGANGFEDSLIIWGDRTAVGVGGGVCQVSTTIFRAAYAGGLPIVERYNHGYVVDWYGEPGLDATIFTPTVDFRFRNDTGAHLLVEPVVDSAGGAITFNLYGTKPDRDVIVADPVVTERQDPEDPSYQIDESLALGQVDQVEWPKEGMTVAVERTIVENGTTRTDTLTSYYQPWRAVYLVGPGTDVP